MYKREKIVSNTKKRLKKIRGMKDEQYELIKVFSGIVDNYKAVKIRRDLQK